VEHRYHTALVLVVIAGLSDGLDGTGRPAAAPEDQAGRIPGPDCRQAAAEFPLPGDVFNQMIAWRYTVMVFSRDLSILVISALLYTVGLRDFRPGIFGKINTACQIAAVFFALLAKVYSTSGCG
jgi:cardiolipin synthase